MEVRRKVRVPDGDRLVGERRDESLDLHLVVVAGNPDGVESFFILRDLQLYGNADSQVGQRAVEDYRPELRAITVSLMTISLSETLWTKPLIVSLSVVDANEAAGISNKTQRTPNNAEDILRMTFPLLSGIVAQRRLVFPGHT